MRGRGLYVSSFLSFISFFRGIAELPKWMANEANAANEAENIRSSNCI